MKIDNWEKLANALGVSIPTAREIMKRDSRLRKAVRFSGVHPDTTTVIVKEAIGGRVLKLKRGKSS